ncbi:hypothetical protein JCM10212_003402 [Sporobolomyces blumeae]
MGYELLYLTLAASFVSLVCSSYTVLRTLLPLLPGHPLNRRANPTNDLSVDAKRPRLKSAQRFTTYLAVTDVFATSVLLWEVVATTISDSPLGSSRLSDSRLYLATTARPTLLLVVAVLSYVNVVQGRAIALGWADCIVWGPAIVLYGVGAGLASMASVDGVYVWIGMAAWLSAVTAIISLCFARLLIAILRVRSITRRDETRSSWSLEQEKVIDDHDLPYRPYSLTFHPNFSGLSTTFVADIGRSTSPHDIIQFSSTPARPATTPEALQAPHDEIEQFAFDREFRSPTPGSLRGLLEHSTTTNGGSSLARYVTQEGDDRPEVLCASSADDDPRRSSVAGESIGSRASTYLAAGGFIGNSAVRNAIIREAWRDQEPPGSGHGPRVELSEKEARGALVRLGGHLASSVLGFALIAPYVFLRLAHATRTPSLVAAILLILGVCQPAVLLAYQSWASEGFWYRRPIPPVPTSSSFSPSSTAMEYEQGQVGPPTANEGDQARSSSRASTMVRTWKDSIPGIRPDGEDCDGTHRTRVGRALSVLSAHPKLQLLSDPCDSSSTRSASATGFAKSTISGVSGHVRLRSLKLSKTSFLERPDAVSHSNRQRSNSTTSRKTVAGHEHGRTHSNPVGEFDKAIARELLRSRRRPARAEPGLPPGPAGQSTPNLVHSGGRIPSPFDFDEHALTTHELTLYPSTTSNGTLARSPTPTPSPSSDPISIDYLSAQVLPHLVPSLRLSRDLRVEPRSDPIPAPPVSRDVEGEKGEGRRSRNVRNLTLVRPSSFGRSRSPTLVNAVEDDPWIAIEDSRTALATDELPLPASPAPNGDRSEPSSSSLHDRSVSNGTRLDISFEWEAVDGTEALELESMSVEGAGERVPSGTFSPILPLSFSQVGNRSTTRLGDSLDGSIVHVGSAFDDADDADVHTGTVHCASIRPISRNSVGSSLELASPTFFRLGGTGGPSDSTSASIGLSDVLNGANRSSITSEGFRNLLNSDGSSWHGSSTPDSARMTFDLDRSRQTSTRGPGPSPPAVRPGHRPLSLLGQRDPNRSSLIYSTTDDDLSKRATKKPHLHLLERGDLPRAPRPTIPLPPVPATIDEVDDEGRTSGAPTPKSHRTVDGKRPEATVEHPLVDTASNPTTLAEIPSSQTPPNVTSRRQKLRSRHQRTRSSFQVADENVNVADVHSVAATPSTRRIAMPSVRSMQ